VRGESGAPGLIVVRRVEQDPRIPSGTDLPVLVGQHATLVVDGDPEVGLRSMDVHVERR